MKKYLILLFGAAISFAFDQYTKWQILGNFNLREKVALIEDRFIITYVQNTGAAFGIFSDYGRVFFLVISLIAIAFIVYVFMKIEANQNMMAVALSLIFGGAVGNLFDRAYHGFVVDFIQITIYKNTQWPTFNVADIAICVGVGILVLELLSQSSELDADRTDQPIDAGLPG